MKNSPARILAHTDTDEKQWKSASGPDDTARDGGRTPDGSHRKKKNSLLKHRQTVDRNAASSK